MVFNKSLIKKPSAWFPIAMSFAALAFVVGYVAIFGISQETQRDEGTPARIFQMLIAGQVPIIGFFVVRWFFEKQKQTLQILALQIVAVLMAFAPVFFLEL